MEAWLGDWRFISMMVVTAFNAGAFFYMGITMHANQRALQGIMKDHEGRITRIESFHKVHHPGEI